MGGRGRDFSSGVSASTSESAYADNSTQRNHKEAINRLSNPVYEDGTYDLATMTKIDYSDGYQVTFWQIGDNYSDAEYAEKVNEFLGASTDRIASAGKYGGSPEVSFHVKDKSVAMSLAKKYNQDSIFDWGTGDCIDNPDGDGINHNTRR